jgi:ribonuclease-3
MGIFSSLKSAVNISASDSTHYDPSGLERIVGYKFKDRSLLVEALTHPSFDTSKSGNRSNQRMEFLGDSILGCVLANWLFKKFPDLPEGELSKRKSLLARGYNLAAVARIINLQDYLIIGKSEQISKGNLRQSVLEDAFEALIGAIFLDSDYLTTEKAILKWQDLFIRAIRDTGSDFNPKGKLQEFLQSQPACPKVSYHLVKQTGPDHQKRFKVEVRVNDETISTGEGPSKKKAEEQAAKSAIKILNSSK